MSPAAQTRLEKAAADNGFDLGGSHQADWISFRSSHSPLRIWLKAQEGGILIAALSRSNVLAALDGFGPSFQMHCPMARAVREVLRISQPSIGWCAERSNYRATVMKPASKAASRFGASNKPLKTSSLSASFWSLYPVQPKWNVPSFNALARIFFAVD